MRHQHQRRAAPRPLLEDEIHDGAARRLVEIAGGLVGHQDRWVGGERPGERDALLLAAGQLRRIVPEPLAEPDLAKLGLGAPEGVAPAGELQRHCDVLERRHGGNEMERLEHDADAPTAEPRQGILVETVDAGALDSDAAALRAFEAGQDREQRRFARPRWTRQPDRFTGTNREADAFEDMDARRSPTQADMDIVERDRLLPHSSSFRGRLRFPYGGGALRRHLLALALVAAVPLMAASAAAAKSFHVVAFGDSLSAGFELPQDAAFPAQLETVLKADGFDATVTNAGVSGDTAEDGAARVDWSVPDGTDLVIVELGANDMLRGMDPAGTKTALDAILARLQARGIKVLLAGMIAAPNLGADYGGRFNAIFPALARDKKVPLYPFFLAGIVGKPDLHITDGMHPNRAGVSVIVRNILPDVEAALRSN